MIFLIIIAILIVILFMMERNKNGKNAGAKQSAGTEIQDSSAATSVDSSAQSEPAESVKMLNLTVEQMHSGDLVLVNGSYAYDFDANAPTVSLVNIHDTQSFNYPVGKEDFEVAGRIMPFLDQLVDACDSAVGSKMTGVASAYRSMEYQQSVWDEMAEFYGEEYARSYVAIPGYSEHHTGLSVDMSIFYEDGSEGTFSESENAVWMNENSYHYGFIRRYAEDKVEVTGIIWRHKTCVSRNTSTIFGQTPEQITPCRSHVTAGHMKSSLRRRRQLKNRKESTLFPAIMLTDTSLQSKLPKYG